MKGLALTKIKPHSTFLYVKAYRYVNDARKSYVVTQVKTTREWKSTLTLSFFIQIHQITLHFRLLTLTSVHIKVLYLYLL